MADGKKHFIVSVSGTLTYELDAPSKEEAIEEVTKIIELDRTIWGVNDWEVMFVRKSKRTKIQVI